MAEIAKSNNADTRHLLAIAPQEFAGELAAWKQRREAAGWTVKVVEAETIYAGSGGKSREAAIQGFVRDHYRRLGGKAAGLHLFLVGDDIPGAPSNEIPIGIAADGVRGDSFYADINNDSLPDIAIGRYPAHSVEDLRAYLGKVWRFEAESTQWTLGVSGGHTGFGKVPDAALRAESAYTGNATLPRNIGLEVFDADPSSPYYAKIGIATLLNRGYSILTYIGHGSPDRLVSHDNFATKDAKTVSIKGRAPIVNALACLAGSFVNRDGVLEELVRNPNGVPAAIGANVIMSPAPTLRNIGNSLSQQIRTGTDTSLGAVVLDAVRSAANGNDIFKRILQELPAAALDKMVLSPNVGEAQNRQARAVHLFGDPSIRWRPIIPETAKQSAHDPRRKLPKVDKAALDRVIGGVDTQAATKGIDSRSASRKDLAHLIFLLDYLGENLRADADRFALLLPKPGQITIKAGIIELPLERRVSIPAEALPKVIRQRIFPSGTPGVIHFGPVIRFAVNLHSAVISLDHITGITIEPTTGFGVAQDLTALSLELPDYTVRSKDTAASSVSQAHVEIVNRNLDTFFGPGSRHRVQLQRDATTGRAIYILQEKSPGAAAFANDLTLASYQIGRPPLMTETGLVVPLPYGQAAHIVDGNALQLRAINVTNKEQQAFVYIPKRDDNISGSGIVQDQFNREAVANRFELIQKMGLAGIPHLSPLMNGPLYAIDPAQIVQRFRKADTPEVKFPTLYGPIFGRSTKSHKKRPAIESGIRPAAPAPSPLSGIPWLSALSNGLDMSTLIHGVEITLVVDTAGGMGRIAQQRLGEIKALLDSIYSQTPDIARHLIHLRIIVGGKTVVPAGELTQETIRQTLSAIEAICFHGTHKTMTDLVGKLLDTPKAGSMFSSERAKKRIVLTNSAGKEAVSRLAKGGHVTVVNIEEPIQIPGLPIAPPAPHPSHISAPTLQATLDPYGLSPEDTTRIAKALNGLRPASGGYTKGFAEAFLKTWHDVIHAAIRQAKSPKILEMEIQTHLGHTKTKSDYELAMWLAAASLASPEALTKIVPTLKGIVAGDCDTIVTSHALTLIAGTPLVKETRDFLYTISRGHRHDLAKIAQNTLTPLVSKYSPQKRLAYYLDRVEGDVTAVDPDIIQRVQKEVEGAAAVHIGTVALLHIVRYHPDGDVSIRAFNNIIATDASYLKQMSPEQRDDHLKYIHQELLWIKENKGWLQQLKYVCKNFGIDPKDFTGGSE